jgi:hypothetical protein
MVSILGMYWIRLNPAVVMEKVKGIYVSWANDPPNPKVKDWNVTELKVSDICGCQLTGLPSW